MCSVKGAEKEVCVRGSRVAYSRPSPSSIRAAQMSSIGMTGQETGKEGREEHQIEVKMIVVQCSGVE